MSTDTQTIHIHNTLSGKKEVFEPQETGKVTIYGCGPTVYDLIHVGNARAFIVQDLAVKTFQAAGYQVEYARNFTDIDDKIIKRAAEKGIDANELANTYVIEFDKDMEALSLAAPQHKPRVTEHLEEITKMISTLIKKGHAYPAETPFGKDVYFRVSSYKDYGKLSKRPIDEVANQSRLEPGEAKESVLDFVLWKAAKPGEPHWDSPWGKGRPGWNIECSAMIDALFPNRLDIHMGGSDLVFPHHENEIAQSEACDHDKPLARYWMHNGMLQIQRQKMSKSLGNFMTLRDFISGFGADVLKLLVHQTHYKSLLDFGGDSILRTEILVEKLYRIKEEFSAQADASTDISTAKAELYKALFDDMNAAKAIGLVFKNIKTLQKNESENSLKDHWHNVYLPFLTETLGILKSDPTQAIANIKQKRMKRSGLSNEQFDEIQNQLEERWRLKENKDYPGGDRIRGELFAKNVKIMDSADGWSWTMGSEELE